MSKISQKYVRSVMKEYAGNIPISREVIVTIQEYLDDECHRIAEAGTKEYLAEVELRKIQKIRPKHRITQDNFKKVAQ
jgi:hypothetical protein